MIYTYCFIDGERTSFRRSASGIGQSSNDLEEASCLMKQYIDRSFFKSSSGHLSLFTCVQITSFLFDRLLWEKKVKILAGVYSLT